MKISINRTDLLIGVLLVNFLIDYIFYIEALSSLSQVFRVVVNVAFLFGAVFLSKDTYTSKWFPLFICIMYWMVLLPRSSDVGKSIPEYIKVVIGMAFVVAGYMSCRNSGELYRFIMRLLVIMPVYLVMVVLSNLFGWGDVSYIGEDSASFKAALGDAKLYAPAFMVGLSPFIVSKLESNSQRYIWSAISITCLIVMILTLRRTALLIIVAVPMIYMLLNLELKKLVRIVGFSSVVVAIAFTKIYSVFEERLESRSYLTSGGYSVSDEGRFMEFFMVLDAFENSGDGYVYIVGMEPFNTINNYGYYQDRAIHVDYTYVFFSSGILGFVFYLTFFIWLLYCAYRLRLKGGEREVFRMFVAIFLVIMAVGVSGNVWAVTYKAFSFAILGAFIGALRNDRI